jgi:hypothetical protein
MTQIFTDGNLWPGSFDFVRWKRTTQEFEGITFGYSFICVHLCYLWFFYFITDDADFHRWDSLAWEF